VLSEIPYGVIVGLKDLALIRLFFPGYDPEERGLAVAIAPDEADPFAGEDIKAHIREKHPGSIPFGYIFYR